MNFHPKGTNVKAQEREGRIPGKGCWKIRARNMNYHGELMTNFCFASRFVTNFVRPSFLSGPFGVDFSSGRWIFLFCVEIFVGMADAMKKTKIHINKKLSVRR